MKLLIFTQVIDKDDSFLSFFHRWVAEFSTHFEAITVVCLKVGTYDLPKNVTVLSLGKESGESRLKYVANFYRYIFSRRNQYDAVFAHMNQEYILLGGIFWRLWGKRVYMWRNHHAGSMLTDMAAAFCTKIFCPSRFSYTAKYKKTVLMPVGIDTDFFKRKKEIERKPGSILFLSRMTPIKKPDLLIDALNILKGKGIIFSASFYGDALPKDEKFYESVKEKLVKLGLNELVSFHSGVPNDRTIDIYNAHEIFVNLSSSGMYDKTIFESAACECLVLATNKNLDGLIDPRFIAKEYDASHIAAKLETILALSQEEKLVQGKALRSAVDESHSLKKLATKLSEALS